MKVNKIGSLPSWLNDLAGILQKQQKSEKEVISETNVMNLPTVNWENETFYVKFDDNGATLYNRFANIAKEIENAKTLEDVDRFLNENLVTAAKEDNDEQGTDELAKELETIMLSEDEEETEEPQTEEKSEDAEKASYDHEAFIALKEEVTEIHKLLNKLIEEELKEEEHKDSDFDIEAKVASLEEKYAELYRAYTAPENDQYDLKSQEQEMQHVQDCIDLSQKVIDKEHELDLSKQEDRGQLNADFLNKVLDDVKENIQDIVDDGIEEAKDVVEDVLKNDVEPEDAVNPESDVQEEDIILLEDPALIDEFCNQVCPFCHQQGLAAVDENNDMIGIKCSNCNKEFAVHTANNDIFYKK